MGMLADRIVVVNRDLAVTDALIELRLEFPRGPISIFGGPDDAGVGVTEGLAFATGYARELDPESFYCALRIAKPRDVVGDGWKRNWVGVKILCARDGRACVCRLVDWGPAEWTKRKIDLSPAAARHLCVATDDEVEFGFAVNQRAACGPVWIEGG